MKPDSSALSRRANSQNPCSSHSTATTTPIPPLTTNGQSVRIAPLPQRHWFAARITYGRAQAVYQALHRHEDASMSIYLPLIRKKVYRIINGQASVGIDERPLHTGLLFINARRNDYANLLRNVRIPGLTPFYDHFSTTETGRNDYLAVPERQFDSFRRIIDSKHDDILIDQALVPNYLAGKQVRIVDGPFAGVEGTLLKWKHQRRVFVDLGELGTFGTGYIRTCEFELL